MLRAPRSIEQGAAVHPEHLHFGGLVHPSWPPSFSGHAEKGNRTRSLAFLACRESEGAGGRAGNITSRASPRSSGREPGSRRCPLTTVRSYKSLALVERAFRCLKTVDLQVRPVYHRLADRVRAHVLLTTSEWHMRQGLAPMLFEDADKQAAEALRTSVVAPAQRSPTAVQKQTTKLSPDGLPVHSSQTLLADLATIAQNTAITPKYPLTMVTQADPYPAQSIPVARAQFVASSTASPRSVGKAIQPCTISNSEAGTSDANVTPH
jgi:hypothetical protein